MYYLEQMLTSSNAFRCCLSTNLLNAQLPQNGSHSQAKCCNAQYKQVCLKTITSSEHIYKQEKE